MSDRDPESFGDNGLIDKSRPSDYFDVLTCARCDNIVLAVGQGDQALSCHGRPMQPAADPSLNPEPTDVRDALLQAFGLPRTAVDIWLYAADEGSTSATEVADLFDYDRSTASRYLNELVELNLLQQSKLNRKSGGVVNVYHPASLEQMRRNALIGFYIWAGKTATAIEQMYLAKRDDLAQNSKQETSSVFWKRSSDDS